MEASYKKTLPQEGTVGHAEGESLPELSSGSPSCSGGGNISLTHTHEHTDIKTHTTTHKQPPPTHAHTSHTHQQERRGHTHRPKHTPTPKHTHTHKMAVPMGKPRSALSTHRSAVPMGKPKGAPTTHGGKEISNPPATMVKASAEVRATASGKPETETPADVRRLTDQRATCAHAKAPLTRFDAVWTLPGAKSSAGALRLMTEGSSAAGGTRVGPTDTKKRKRKPNMRQRRKAREDAASASTSTTAVDAAAEDVPPTDRTQAQTATPTEKSQHNKASQKRGRLEDSVSPRGENKRQKLGTPLIKSAATNYSSAVKADLIVAITVDGINTLTIDQSNWIQNHLLELIINRAVEIGDEEAESGPLFIGKPTMIGGALQLWCADTKTQDWIKLKIEGTALPSGEKLTVKRPADIPRRVRCGIAIPGVHSTTNIGRVLKYQNPWAHVERWLLHGANTQTNTTFVIVSIPEDVVSTIVAHERRLGFALGSVYVKFQGPKGRFLEQPPPHHTEAASSPAGNKPTKETTPLPQNIEAASTSKGGSSPSEDLEQLSEASEMTLSESGDDWVGRMLDINIEDEGSDHGNGVPFTQ